MPRAGRRGPIRIPRPIRIPSPIQIPSRIPIPIPIPIPIRIPSPAIVPPMMIFPVVYPGGEHAHGYGYPGQVLTISEVPAGPEACFLDEVEVDFAAAPPGSPTTALPVRRVVGGPRRPTYHVRVAGTPAEVEAWMDARDAEGWVTGGATGDPALVWIVAGHDDLAVAELERDGQARLVR